jgi:hypothetical protein
VRQDWTGVQVLVSMKNEGRWRVTELVPDRVQVQVPCMGRRSLGASLPTVPLLVQYALGLRGSFKQCWDTWPATLRSVLRRCCNTCSRHCWELEALQAVPLFVCAETWAPNRTTTEPPDFRGACETGQKRYKCRQPALDSRVV